MNVAELIAKLQEFPADMPVHADLSYQDYVSDAEVKTITVLVQEDAIDYPVWKRAKTSEVARDVVMLS